MRPIQNIFRSTEYPDLLVGLDDPDDAAVWRLSNERALIVTTDFFTPVVDDPYDYGSIAAANALSDVYAMGGEPFMALNIAALPPDLPPEISADILRGGADKALQAGVVLAGGHTVQDKEPKYGLVVLGFVDPKQLITKKGAQPGDALVISKPLGFGTITTALKRGEASSADVAEVVQWMTRLNRDAARAAVKAGVRGGTDITGFGLLGHASEMAVASKVGLQFNFSQIPLVSSARRYASEWIFPGGSHDNWHYYSPFVKFVKAEEHLQMLLFDAQTSGGLLLSVPADRLSDFQYYAAELDQPVWVIGEVVEGDGITVI